MPDSLTHQHQEVSALLLCHVYHGSTQQFLNSTSRPHQSFYRPLERHQRFGLLISLDQTYLPDHLLQWFQSWCNLHCHALDESIPQYLQVARSFGGSVLSHQLADNSYYVDHKSPTLHLMFYLKHRRFSHG
ncbi:Uncharacterised protein [Acinetobacter baumannii]|nr:Uncharacterised protein [Acinetobacter baumannii]